MARIDQIEKLLKEDPSDSFLLFALAKEYEKLENLDHALNTYQKLLDVDHKYVGLYYHLGKLYEILDKKENALSTYDQGIKIAQEAKDLHSLSELQSAKMNCEID